MPPATTTASSSSPLILRSLYRSLWRAIRPFTPPSPAAVSFQCLLDRTGHHHQNDVAHGVGPYPAARSGTNDGNNNSNDTDDDDTRIRWIWSRLVREVITTTTPSSSGPTEYLQMRFPGHVVAGLDNDYDSTGGDLMRRILRREFRMTEEDSLIARYLRNDDPRGVLRKQLAFLALRKLNAKLSFCQELWHKQQQQRQGEEEDEMTSSSPSSWHVEVLPEALTEPTSPSYLSSGTFLIAHPNLTGYFRRTVICILHHQVHNNNNDRNNDDAAASASTSESSSSSSSSSFSLPGSYGLIINRPCPSQQQSSSLVTLGQALDHSSLPEDVDRAFGQQRVWDGGPVHASLQMLRIRRRRSDGREQEHNNDNDKRIGGQILEPHPRMRNGDESSSASSSDPLCLYYRGDVQEAAGAVLNDSTIDVEDFRFFVGASAWTPGQLESEIARGYWLPCAVSPVTLAATTTAQRRRGDDDDDPVRCMRAMDDVYLRFLAACGPDEAALAALVRHDDDEDHPFRNPSDDFS